MTRQIKKIVLAPDSFKGTLSASRVCDLLAQIVAQTLPGAEIRKYPMSDGGEGFLSAMLLARGGSKTWVRVAGPLGSEIEAPYGVLTDGSVVIEMASASGLTLVDEASRDGFHATSLGTGQLMRHALQRGFRNLIIGLGGSASVDGGAGAASSLGIRYLDKNDNEIQSGAGLTSLDHIDRSAMLPELNVARITFAVDVTNPLTGENGAARIFGPQKGASPQQVELLDSGLKKLGQILMKDTKSDYGSLPGAGAAGGVAVPFLAYAGAKLARGIELMMDAYGFDTELETADLVITGEGRTDAQSAMGKVLAGIGEKAASHQVPVIALSGTLGPGYQVVYEHGISAVFSTIRSADDLNDISGGAEKRLQSAAAEVLKLIAALTIKEQGNSF